MTTIGYATLQLIPVLAGVTEEVNKQLEGKTVPIKVEPKVDEKAATEAARKTQEAAEKYMRDNKIVIAPKADPKAAEDVGKATKETVEKHTKDVKVTPKADPAAAEKAGKDTGDAVTKGVSGSTSEIGKLITRAVELAAAGAGREAGKMLAEKIPEGMTGLPGTIGELLKKTLPSLGAAAGAATAAAIGTALSGGLGTHVEKAGKTVASGLVAAVNKVEPGVKIAQSIGTSLNTGLGKVTGAINTGVAAIQGKVATISTAIDHTKELLGGNDSWAAPGLDFLQQNLGKVAPILATVTAATEVATAVQGAFNVILMANPIGAIVIAIAALVAGLVWFFTQTEVGRKIWERFTEYLKVAWAAIKVAFEIAWGAIKIVWEAMVTKADEVWQKIKAAFGKIVDFVKGLPSQIAEGAKGMWNGIGDAFKTMVNGLISVWNSFANGLTFTPPDIPGMPGRGQTFHPVPTIPSLATGGYTGDGALNQIAGVVHGGEFVIKKDSTDRLRTSFPGLLELLNRGYAGGGLVDKAKQFAVSMDPARYLMGGFNTSAIDCSGFVSAVANVATGRPAFQSRMATPTEGPWLKSLGFKIGSGGAGDLRVGWWDRGGGANGHTAGTFPDGTNFESNSSEGVVVGGSTGANHPQFSQHAFLQFAKAAVARPGEPVGNPNAGGSGRAPNPVAPDGSAAPSNAGDAAPVSGSAATSGITMPSTISGLSSWGLSDLNVKSTVPKNDYYKSPERTFQIGTAAASAVEGQVSSALGGLGILNSPAWLNAASTFVKGINIGPSNAPHAGSGAAPGPGNGVAPAVNVNPPADVPDAVRSQASPARNPSGATYNIRTSTVEDSFLQANRREKELAAMILSRF